MTAADEATGAAVPSQGTLPAGGRGVVGPRLPNLVIAGVTKAGTTSLYRYLTQHPDICPADEKELRHFLPLRYGQELAPLADYAQHFVHSTGQPYAMEASPGYFYGGAAIAEAIAGTLTDPRVIISLREPGQRCFSFFTFMKSRAQLPQELEFDTWLAHAEQLHAEGVDQLPEHHSYSGLGTGCYAQWMAPWLATFGDDLRIEWFDDLANDPVGTVQDLCRWLGLDAEVAAGFGYRVENKSVQFRLKRVQQAALRLNKRNVLFFERHQGIKRAIRGVYYLVNRAPSRNTMSPAARRRLDAFYAPYNAQLVEQLGERAAQRPAWLR